MANSTAVVTDLTTLASDTATAASVTQALSEGYVIQSMTEILQLKAVELRAGLQQLLSRLNASDPMYQLASNILGTMS